MDAKIRLASAEGTDTATSPRKTGKAAEGPSKKFTVQIPGETDFRLYGVASSMGLSKAELVLKLVNQGLERYTLDPKLKAVYAEIVAKASEAA